MSTLSPAQIAYYAANAGFTGSGLTAAVAVALAESGGRTTAVNVNADRWKSRDRGLWQINDHWHPEVTDTAAFLPLSAAAAAFRISKGGRDWSPWSTWKNGAAAAQMGRARLAVAQGGSRSTSTSSTTAQPAGWSEWMDGLGAGIDAGKKAGVPGLGLTPLEGLNDNPLRSLNGLLAAVVHAGAWMSDSHNWARVAMVAGGTVGILIGAGMVARSGAAGSTVASASKIATPTNLIPIGRIANVAKAAAAGK